MQDLKIEYLRPQDLMPYEHNARKHEAADIDAIKASIRDCGGFNDPIGIWGGQNLIVEGHGRQVAAIEMGLERVPCVRLDHLTEEQRRAYALAHNKTAELSTWDFEEMEREVEALTLEGFDMAALGFDVPDIEELGEIVEDEPPELPEEPTAKLGDIYQLGVHRLMCGDSTDAEDVRALMDGAEADLLLTDPPYNCDVGRCERPHSSNNGVHILNDSMPESEFIQFLTAALWNAERSMRRGAAYYIWYAGMHHIEFESAVRAVEEFKLHEQLIWVKSHFVLGRNSDYQWMHECCLYGWKEGATHYFTDSRAESTVIEDEAVKLSTMKKCDLIALCEKLLGQNQAGSVLRADKPNAADLHPTVKPQALIAPLIRNSSKRGWNVLDLFGGSGSTLIACEQTGRRCYMMELDPHYVDVIIERWEKLTGKKAVKLA